MHFVIYSRIGFYILSSLGALLDMKFFLALVILKLLLVYRWNRLLNHYLWLCHLYFFYHFLYIFSLCFFFHFILIFNKFYLLLVFILIYILLLYLLFVLILNFLFIALWDFGAIILKWSFIAEWLKFVRLRLIICKF